MILGDCVMGGVTWWSEEEIPVSTLHLGYHFKPSPSASTSQSRYQVPRGPGGSQIPAQFPGVPQAPWGQLWFFIFACPMYLLALISFTGKGAGPGNLSLRLATDPNWNPALGSHLGVHCISDAKPTGAAYPACEWRYDACASPCFQTCRDPQAASCQDVPR